MFKVEVFVEVIKTGFYLKTLNCDRQFLFDTKEEATEFSKSFNLLDQYSGKVFMMGSPTNFLEYHIPKGYQLYMIDISLINLSTSDGATEEGE